MFSWLPLSIVVMITVLYALLVGIANGFQVMSNTDFLTSTFKHINGSACCAASVNENPVKDTHECSQRCTDEIACEAFVFQPSSGSCWLGRAVGFIPIPAIDREAGVGISVNPAVFRSRDELPALLTAYIPNSLGILLGVGRGEFVKTILQAKWGGGLYLVDPYIHIHSGYKDPANVDDRTHQLIYEQLRTDLHKAFQNRHVFVRDFSVSFVDTWKEKAMPSPAFIYVDNNHSELGVLKDLTAWWGVLAPGGVMAGNMYLDDPSRFIGVRAAVDDFFVNKDVTVLRTQDISSPNWIVFKPL